MKRVTLSKICKYAGFLWYAFLWYVFSRICPWILSIYGKFGSEKTFIFAYLMQCETESTGKLTYNILFRCIHKILFMKRQTCSTDIFHWIFLAARSNRYICWALILNLLNSNQIPQASGWCLVPISDLNNLKRHIII